MEWELWYKTSKGKGMQCSSHTCQNILRRWACRNQNRSCRIFNIGNAKRVAIRLNECDSEEGKCVECKHGECLPLCHPLCMVLWHMKLVNLFCRWTQPYLLWFTIHVCLVNMDGTAFVCGDDPKPYERPEIKPSMLYSLEGYPWTVQWMINIRTKQGEFSRFLWQWRWFQHGR